MYQRDDGALVGPFAPLLYTPPAIAQHYMQAILALSSIPGFPASAKETAILATGALFKCDYERYAHENIAQSSRALSKSQTSELVQGTKPADADEAISIAFDVTIALVQERGPLGDALWERASDQFGKQGAMALVHYVGAYCYTSVILNGADVKVPEH